MKNFFTLLSITCAFIFIVACSSAQSSPSTPEGVGKAFAKYQQDGDYEAYANLMYFGDNEEKSAKMREQALKVFGMTVKPYTEKQGGIKSYDVDVQEVSDDGSSAYVVVKLIYGNGESITHNLTLVFVNGKWYIES